MRSLLWAFVLSAPLVQAQIPFTPVTPCRVVDTRAGEGQTGMFGPPQLAANGVRTVPIPQNTRCNIPAGVSAYSLNITVVPAGPLQFLTVYPTGQARPGVSTLNSFDGRIVANAAIVPAGTNNSIDVFVTNPSDVIIDVNGYFGAAGQTQMRFFPVTPCRVVDTRVGEGKTGSFGPPTPAALSSRDVPVPQSTCGIPADARAYSFNVTVVPPGQMQFLTIWPTGAPRPNASTLNSFEGRVVANQAVVPAGTNGSISFFVSNATDVILDINGYFRP